MKDTVPDNKVLLDCAMIISSFDSTLALEGVLARRSELFQLCFQVLFEQFFQLCFHLLEGVVADFGHIRRRLFAVCLEEVFGYCLSLTVWRHSRHMIL